MLITAGKIIKPHGIKGEVCLESYLDSPSLFLGHVFLQFGKASPKQYTIKSYRAHQGRLLATFENISDRTTAESLRGASVLIPKQNLAEPIPGEFYIQDLIGLKVLLVDTHELIGQIVNVMLDTGQELWVIESAQGKEILFPAVPEFVEEIDLDKEEVLINPPEGLLELYL